MTVPFNPSPDVAAILLDVATLAVVAGWDEGSSQDTATQFTGYLIGGARRREGAHPERVAIELAQRGISVPRNLAKASLAFRKGSSLEVPTRTGTPFASWANRSA